MDEGSAPDVAPGHQQTLGAVQPRTTQLDARRTQVWDAVVDRIQAMRTGEPLRQLREVDFIDEAYVSTPLAHQLARSSLLGITQEAGMTMLAKMRRAFYVLLMLMVNDSTASSILMLDLRQTRNDLPTIPALELMQRGRNKAVDLKACVIFESLVSRAIEVLCQHAATHLSQVHEDDHGDGGGGGDRGSIRLYMVGLRDLQMTLVDSLELREDAVRMCRDIAGIAELPPEEADRRDDEMLREVAVALRPLSPSLSTDLQTGRVRIDFGR